MPIRGRKYRWMVEIDGWIQSIKMVFRTAIEFNVSKYFANLKLHLIKAVSTQTVSRESGLESLHSWQDMTPTF